MKQKIKKQWTITGRIKKDYLPLQNIPIRTKLGVLIKRVFIMQPK